MSYVAENQALNANIFGIEIKGENIVTCTSVEGLQVENEAKELIQMGKDGKQIYAKVLGTQKYVGELTIKRLAPNAIDSDPFWKWMTDIRKSGTADDKRKDGSVVIFDFTAKEVSRWNFFNAWPSKIAQDGVDASKSDMLHESITLQYDKIERIK